MKLSIAVAAAMLLLGACSLFPADPPLPPPPPIAVTPAPKPAIVVQQVCIQPDTWAPGEQAAAAEALAPVVKANPAAAHLLREWFRLRAVAVACLTAQK